MGLKLIQTRGLIINSNEAQILLHLHSSLNNLPKWELFCRRSYIFMVKYRCGAGNNTLLRAQMVLRQYSYKGKKTYQASARQIVPEISLGIPRIAPPLHVYIPITNVNKYAILVYILDFSCFASSCLIILNILGGLI